MAFGSFQQALAAAGVSDATLDAADRRSLDHQGYVILRRVIAAAALDDLRARFEDKILASAKWPAPREHGTRHAFLDNDDAVRRVCLSPPVLAAVAHALPGRFYMSDVQGRDPCPGGGYQALHRDWPDDGEGPRMVVGLAFLDGFDEANGATRLVPGTHGEPGEMNDHAHYAERHPRQVVLRGESGDILLFHGRLVHAGLRNTSGAPRRTLQICYRDISTYATHRESRELSNVAPLDRYLMGAD
ncbi:MAG TPA: phytanoyl-CoA dioxygenase family protein [Rhizomicrobium sp.]